ncbi:MAG: T9SS type A sorting domain-containing protein [Bacteroidetes bacterium]|nr:T9SS type A sorting domain-containing protein [Bacteroidota bacterium]
MKIKHLLSALSLMLLPMMVQAQTIYYVKSSMAASGAGTGWNTAFKTLQEALSVVTSGDQIWVAAGTYKPGTNRTDAFVMKNGVAIYGGFPNSGNPTLTERNWVSNVTILSGDINDDDVVSGSGSTLSITGNGENCYHVIYNNVNGLTATAILDGFTIKGGNANEEDNDDNYGGGMYNHGTSPTVTHCIFSGNAAYYGAGMNNRSAGSRPFPTVNNCTFSNNLATQGGGMYNEGSTPTVTNCTFMGNKAIREGGGMRNFSSSRTIVKNCIFWGNNTQIQNYLSDNTVYSYCLVQGGYAAGTNILDLDPLFVDATNGNLRLHACSPAINAGENTGISGTDLDNNSRIYDNGIVDLGAYEYQGSTASLILYVKTDGDDTKNGQSWANAYKTLQKALQHSCTGTQIWVAAGTYYPDEGAGNINNSNAASFIMKEGVAIYGGFLGNGSETQLSDRNWKTNVTTLSGDIDQNDGPNFANNEANSSHVIYNNGNGLTNAAILDGFVISGGYIFYDGSGMYNNNVSPTVTNCSFVGNKAGGKGGGIYNENAHPTVTNCSFVGNSAFEGAGMINITSNPKVTNCAFWGNGGYGSTGMHNLSSNPILTNCSFSGQSVMAYIGSNPTLKNCILWGNINSSTVYVSNPVYINTIVKGQNLGSGVFDGTREPLFVLPPTSGNVVSTIGDLRLHPCSPALNQGSNDENATITDLDGNPRKVGTIDLGAYEYQGSTASITPVIATNSTTTCGGSNGSITLSGFLPNTIYSVTYIKGTTTVPAANLTADATGSITISNLSADSYTNIVATYGACVSTAATATVSDPVPPTANIVTTNSSICVGGNASFTVSGPNGATLTYTLTGVSGNQTLLLNGSNQTITANNAPTDVTLTLVSVSKDNCSLTLGTTSTVVVNPTPNAVATPSSQTICSTSAINTIVLSGNVANTSYNWTRDNSATITGIADSGSGNISGSLTNTTNAPITVTFTITSTANNCPGTSITATVLVNPTPNAVATPSSQTICSTSAINAIVLSGNVVNTTYNWMRDNTGTVTGIADSGSGNISGSLTNTTNAPITVTFTITPTANNCPGTSIMATVLVNPTPNAVATPSSQTICSTSAINAIVLSGNVATTTYNWTRDNSATVTGIADSGSGNISGSLTNTTNAPITVTFTITPTANNCPGTSITATVLVNPTPNAVATPSSQTICSTTAINTIVLSGNVNGTTYNWTRDNTMSVLGIADSGSGNISGSLTNTTNAPITVTFTITSTANNCPGTPITATVLVNALPMAMISGATTVCQNSPSPSIIFTGANGTAPYAFTYQINGGPIQMASTNVGSNSVTVPVPTTTVGEFTYTLLSVSESSSTSCSQVQSGSVVVKVQGKPTITLSTLQQSLNEGNSQTFCDIDANPVNSLQFTVLGGCVVGTPVWRVQVGSGSWSDWSANAPVSQPSNNQPHRYQAACDASCPVTYTTPVELTINYRSTVPQNVSLLVDGVTVLMGESKEVCSLVTIPLTFNANCSAGEVTLYSVDGGEYSSGVPTNLVDNQYHNYRVRCRKSDGTPSCVESESGVMRLKLVTIPSAPTVSLSSTSSCDATASFSGQSNCGSLRTVWYNATTNVALPNLPSTVPSATTSYYARCQTENGCVSEKSNVVTFTLTSTQVAPVITASQEIVCTGTSVTISANCPAGSQTFWNMGVTTPSFEVSFNNVTKQTYWAKCIFAGGCQSAESVRKDIYWNAFVVTLINVGESKSSVKTNDRAAWAGQFIKRDGGPELEQSTQVNPTLYFVENANKVAPRYWTINVEACGLSTDGSLTFDMLATPEMGVIRSFNTHENNAPYFMYANRDGWTELYAQNHPAYGFYQDNGAGGNVYDLGLPKGLYKLGVRYWDQKGWGSIYPSTRKPQGNVLAYQEYWFRIQSKDGVGVGAARTAGEQGASNNSELIPPSGRSAARVRGLFVLPNPVTNILRLQVQDSKGQSVQTVLTDASGRQVLRRGFVPETNTHQEEFVVSELPTGMYFLKVTTSEQQATLKVVKVP